jgi:hypothetical protein
VVAIPALFGYNYLSVQVKDITTDLHLFLEEFMTKMAECYPETEGKAHGSHPKLPVLKPLMPAPPAPSNSSVSDPTAKA